MERKNNCSCLTKILGEFVTKREYKDIPIKTLDRTKRLLLDFIGCALAGSKLGGLAEFTLAYFNSQGGKSESTVIGHDNKLPSANAAFLNGILGHELELDDGYRYGTAHPGAVVIPASLAIAEQKGGTTGKEILTSIALGYEVMLRIAKSINISHRRRGFFTTGTCGPFGAAAASSKILNLKKNKIVNALNIAGILGAGLVEVVHSGQMIKPLAVGRAAQSGVMASLLASRGVTGPKTILEGKDGFAAAMTDSFNNTPIRKTFENGYEISNVYIKPYPTCRHVHPSIDLVLSLKRAYNLSAENIQEVVVKTYSLAVEEVGEIHKPNNIWEAKYSIPFAVATVLKFGKATLHKFSEDAINNTNVQKLADKVKVEEKAEIEAKYPNSRGAEVIISLKDGTAHKASEELPKGEPENPLDPGELNKKFFDCSHFAIADAKAQKLINRINSLEKNTLNSLLDLTH